jgi:HK97 family phage portal protein
MPGRAGQPYRDSWDMNRAVDYGLNRSIWVYRAINAIATNQARLPMVARKGDWIAGPELRVGATRDILKLLNYQANPNEHATAIFRKRLTQILLLNRQGVMIEIIRDRAGRPLALYILPPGYTHPIPDERTFVSGFRVWFPGKSFVDLPPENVIWIREPHPTDPYLGITPLEAAGINVEMDYYSRLYNRNFLANDMRPGGILVLKGHMDDADADELRRRFSGYGPGYAGAGRLTAIESDQGADFVDTGAAPRDGHYLQLDRLTRESILLAFGVPESIAGNASGRTFANADAEKEIFWQETMLPHLDMIARGFDRLIDDDPEHFASYDFTSVPILERYKREAAAALKGEHDAGLISVDEYREGTGRKAVGHSKLYIGQGQTAVIDVAKPFQPLEDPAAGAGGEDPMAGLGAPAEPFGAPDSAGAGELPGSPSASLPGDGGDPMGPTPQPEQDPAGADAPPSSPDPYWSQVATEAANPAPGTPEWWAAYDSMFERDEAKSLEPIPVRQLKAAPVLPAPREDLWTTLPG